MRVIREPESSRPSTIAAAHLSLAALDLGIGQRTARRARRARSVISAEHLVGLARLAAGVDAELAGVGVAAA